MLMESRTEDSHGSEKVKKSRSLDLQSLYDQKQSVSVDKKGSLNSNLKRKRGAEDQSDGRTKNKKEVPLGSVSSGKKSRKRLDEVYKGGLSSGSGEPSKSESGSSQKCNHPSDLGGIALNLNDSIVQVPKRPRDFTRRKKLDVDLLPKEGTSGSRTSNLEKTGKFNGDPSRNVARNGNFTQDSAETNDLSGDSKARRIKNFVDDRERTQSNGRGPPQLPKKEGDRSSVHNGDLSSKKAKRNQKKNGSGLDVKRRVKEPKPDADDSVRFHHELQDDDEENLEANAARMLSSRFDPSCTGFAGSNRSSKSPPQNGLSSIISSSRDLIDPGTQAESDSASGDRVLRPRDQHRQKGLTGKRRRFYEILSKDLDAHWVLNRRIKIFWPLDQKWYFGLVSDYDSNKKVHHIKYDDRDEEWVNLQNERFKLLLLPSEVPDKVGKKKRRKKDNHVMKGKDTAIMEDDCQNGSSMESEPIISWLARSSNQIKSSSAGIVKKQKKADKIGAFQSSSLSTGRKESPTCLDASSSGRDTDKFDCSSAVPDTSGSGREHGICSAASPAPQDDKRTPIVYFRRRFHKRERGVESVADHGLGNILDENAASVREGGCQRADRSLSFELHDSSVRQSADDVPFWSIDSAGRLTFNAPAHPCKFSLCFPVPLSSILSLGVENLWVVHASWMLQHGTLMTAWPMVRLEMLFVDNIVGLRFLLFEGCLKQVVVLAFLVLAAFYPSNEKRKRVDQQLPVTSIRFRFSCLLDVMKQLVFVYYNFMEVDNSKWLYLDRKLKRHCLLAKQLPPPECTYDNIKALRHGCYRLPVTSGQSSAIVQGLQMKSRWPMTRISNQQSSSMRLRRLPSNIDERLGRLPPFALSFPAAPTFFLKLHLKLLMERSISWGGFDNRDSLLLLDYPENDGNSGSVGCSGVDVCHQSLQSPGCDCTSMSKDVAIQGQLSFSKSSKGKSAVSVWGDGGGVSVDPSLSCKEGEVVKASKTELVCALSAQKDHRFHRQVKTHACPPNGITIKIPPFNLGESATDYDAEKHLQVTDSVWNANNGATASPYPRTCRSSSHQGRSCLSSPSVFETLSPVVQDGRPAGFSSGPRKPRTQVSYSLPAVGQDLGLKNKNSRGFSHKRIRRSMEKKISDASGRSQRNMEFLSCDANVLVTTADRGWRECGARIVLELFDHNEWRLAIRISGVTKFSYKAHQVLQPGTTNRYTHAMMWKGGKDWILEFQDRSQWMLFKEMHEECCDRNFRAALVKNIPIPGVRFIEEDVDNGVETPFVRPPSAYLCQVQNDVDMAMDPSRVLYDMDSEDELWISNIRSSTDRSVCGDITDEMFEKTMDTFEKVAYAKQSDHLAPDDLEEIIADTGSMEAIKIIYEHWQEKRQKKGMPLIRNLQPPLWEKYQQQVKQWESAMMKSNAALLNGCHGKTTKIEKPPIFAFCFKPRGLEVFSRGSKHRSHRKLPIAGPSCVIAGDLDAFHSFGRRSTGYTFGDEKLVAPGYMSLDSPPLFQPSPRAFSPRDAGGMGQLSLSSDGPRRNHYPKLYRNKSKKIGSILYPNDLRTLSPQNRKNCIQRNGNNGFTMGPHEWPSQNYYEPERSQRHFIEQQLDASDLDEFRLRDASSAAQHAINMAKLKREKAQRLLYRADLAIHKAVVALMTADAIKAASESSSKDV